MRCGIGSGQHITLYYLLKSILNNKKDTLSCIFLKKKCYIAGVSLQHILQLHICGSTCLATLLIIISTKLLLFMKKRLLIAALFGATALQAQNVGIGISSPVSSAKLDITAADRGVLIPRVALTNTTLFAPITGVATASLLVYNSNSIND